MWKEKVKPMLVTWGIIAGLLYLFYVGGQPSPKGIPWYLAIIPGVAFISLGLCVSWVVLFPKQVEQVFEFFGDEPSNGDSDDE